VSVKVWKIDRNAILRRLERWARKIGKNEKVVAVILFGSLARRDYTAASDADILIILRNSSVRFDERIPTFLPSDIGIGVDVFPYTIDEVKKALKEEWGVARFALEESLFLFKREREFNKFFG